MNIDLSRINLNLLIALDALLKEKHVTNAGKRIHISQSAMSNLLKNLREIFKDELFIRGQASRLIPTSFALALEPQVTEAIEKINLVFQGPETFTPQHAKITFTIGLSDYIECVLFPKLVQKISQQAPGMEIRVKHLNYIKNKNTFDYEDINLAIGIYTQIPDILIAQRLFIDKAVCLGSKHNRLLKPPINKKTFSQAKQIAIQFFERREELLTERNIKKLGLKRHVIVTHPHALTAPYILIGTDLVSITLERLAKLFTQWFPLTYQPMPFFTSTYPIHMVWHPKEKNNMAHRWLREMVLSIANELIL